MTSTFSEPSVICTVIVLIGVGDRARSIQGPLHEGDANRLAVPAGELRDIGAPANIGSQGCDLPVMLTCPPTAGVPGEKKPVLVHQPVDPLGVDRGQAGGATLALEESRDPPVAIGRPCVDQTPDLGCQLQVTEGYLTSG